LELLAYQAIMLFLLLVQSPFLAELAKLLYLKSLCLRLLVLHGCIILSLTVCTCNYDEFSWHIYPILLDFARRILFELVENNLTLISRLLHLRLQYGRLRVLQSAVLFPLR